MQKSRRGVSASAPFYFLTFVFLISPQLRIQKRRHPLRHNHRLSLPLALCLSRQPQTLGKAITLERLHLELALSKPSHAKDRRDNGLQRPPRLGP